MCWGSTIPFSAENSLSFLWILLILQATFHAIGSIKNVKLPSEFFARHTGSFKTQPNNETVFPLWRNDWLDGLNVLLKWFPNGYKKRRLIKYSHWRAVLNSSSSCIIHSSQRSHVLWNFLQRGKMKKSINVHWKSKGLANYGTRTKRTTVWSFKIIIRKTL